eukprot:CAMPEP_0201539392 /NCGR_PEP_ID=MMETSP0161_2-20130828/70280_1 /ASSEMBLY_ACC=CAM_ASM_000251 /TAXON_ID=180227 /ORGANISM="Neoparamoeba aestuarina, Strain SoJaBio B1-5/56/2" /LENGTH=106 /DNA_ID=CAMNT_0047946749 /DNA_START=451 /DNA_END=771 /DNA_ORIENTATION=-
MYSFFSVRVARHHDALEVERRRKWRKSEKAIERGNGSERESAGMSGKGKKSERKPRTWKLGSENEKRKGEGYQKGVDLEKENGKEKEQEKKTEEEEKERKMATEEE